MIRQGQLSDIPEIVRMSEDFWCHTIFYQDYDEPCDPDSVAAMAEACINNGLMSVLEIDGVVCGFACAVKGALLANFKVLIGSELAWWVDEQYRSGSNGIKLMKHLEDLARDQGIKYFSMVYMQSSMPGKVKKIYESMGYVKTETNYVRAL